MAYWRGFWRRSPPNGGMFQNLNLGVGHARTHVDARSFRGSSRGASGPASASVSKNVVHRCSPAAYSERATGTCSVGVVRRSVASRASRAGRSRRVRRPRRYCPGFPIGPTLPAAPAPGVPAGKVTVRSTLETPLRAAEGRAAAASTSRARPAFSNRQSSRSCSRAALRSPHSRNSPSTT